MLKKPESELQIVKSRNPLATVEVDIDCIPECLNGYGGLVVNAITPIAIKSPNMKATIYVYQGPSINFHKKTWSVFFGVAGNKKLLDVILNAFRGAEITNTRFSDYIDPSTATIDFHIQDGLIWRPLEDGTWHAESQDDKESAEDSITELVELENVTEPEFDGYASRTSTPSRFRSARADATVGTIRGKIEEVFGLPEGSVALCGPDKKALRGDATINTLRKRWD